MIHFPHSELASEKCKINSQLDVFCVLVQFNFTSGGSRIAKGIRFRLQFSNQFFKFGNSIWASVCNTPVDSGNECRSNDPNVCFIRALRKRPYRDSRVFRLAQKVLEKVSDRLFVATPRKKQPAFCGFDFELKILFCFDSLFRGFSLWFSSHCSILSHGRTKCRFRFYSNNQILTGLE